MDKKIVWLPYDFDTAIGTNNEGALVFSYNLEDTDHLTGGADIFNGQESVVWVNMRQAFADEIKTMYQTLRSQGILSYAVVEQMFENHQSKWPEAIFNEDSYFKYLAPLVAPDAGTEPTASYLGMLQGSKAEQRKWWLYNRFRYIDSKYNAGDALSDVIQLRGYAKSNVTITPYADVYVSVKFGSYLVQSRGTRNVATTVVCPLDNVNDTEIYIYSASQLSNVGDLSGLKVGFADFSNGTKLSSLKVGDSDSNYTNANLKELYVGNNGLLKILDVRNCPNLGTDNQTSVDLSGCANIENIYFDGTAILGCTLPNGGNIKVLHLPSTITNLTIQNQQSITDFTMPSYSNITTLRIENSAVNSKAILNAIAANSRVRLIGFTWECEDATEIEALLDKLDTMRGLDEQGNNTETAQVSGTIHTSSLTGNQIASYNARYPYITVTADHTTAVLYYYNGNTLITSQTIQDGGNGSYSGATPTKAQTAQYTYTFAGWSKGSDDNTVDSDALNNVVADRNVYACYTSTVRTYTVTWKNADNTTLETDQNVPYGTVPTYNGATPTYQGQTSSGWQPAVAAITGDTTYTATYVPMYTATFVTAAADGGQTLQTSSVAEGSTPVYTGATPTTTQGDTTEFEFSGWSPTPAPIYANTTYTAVFTDLRAVTVQYLSGTIKNFESDSLTKFGQYSFRNRTMLETAKAPVTTVEQNAFQGCTAALHTVDLSATSGAVTIAANAFDNTNFGLTHLIIRSSTMATLSNVNAFAGTKIALGMGAVYVPTALVSTYKADSKWGNYYIADINDYPLTDFSTISDSWATIIANSNYATDYAIGDTKSIDFGTYGTHLMELVALDTDDKADNSGKARMTWISKTLITTHRMNATGTTRGGWTATEMRSWLKSDIKPLLPSAVQNAIVEVTKVSGTYENSAVVKNGQTSTEDVWIPSDYEVGFGTTYEDTGAIYSTKFRGNTSRVKYTSSGSNGWWLRSAFSGANFRNVTNNGNAGGNSAINKYGVALGFCI